MTKHIDETAVEQWLLVQRDALDADLATSLDLEAGLREVLIAAQREAIADDLSEVLDLDAGLAAIVPESVPVPPARQDIKRTYDVGRFDDDVTAIKELSINDRWALRTKMLRNGLELAYEIAWALASDYDDDTPEKPVSPLFPDWSHWILAHQERFDYLSAAVERGLEEGAYYIRGHIHMDHPSKDVLLQLWGHRIAQVQRIARIAAEWRNAVVHRGTSRGVPYRAAINNMCEVASALADTVHAVNDFVGEDLREAGLEKDDLDGVRWSVKTKWPPEWLEEIDRDSVPIGNGVFEVRQGNARTSLV
ncbi:hypothetical protein [Nocardia anaemiae]|uniref:hypothetical protein n=1 Tax=Nocardia anaemiae TaxID=263910 RepID=UPI0007A41EFC|nr:hypothetical protein [Nocardia anaemiae]